MLLSCCSESDEKTPKCPEIFGEPVTGRGAGDMGVRCPSKANPELLSPVTPFLLFITAFIHPEGICSQQAATVNPPSPSLLSWGIWGACWGPIAAGSGWGQMLGCTNPCLASPGASAGSGGGWGVSAAPAPPPCPRVCLAQMFTPSSSKEFQYS